DANGGSTTPPPGVDEISDFQRIHLPLFFLFSLSSRKEPTMFKGRSFLVKMVKDDEAGHEEEVDVTEDIRSHFQRNKNAYIAGFSGFAFASITCLIMRERHAGVQSASDGPAKVTMRPLTFFSSRTNSIVDASETIVNVIEREGRGHPGYLTECIE